MNYFDKSAIIINQICEKIEPGKKMLQKLMYLIERKGVTLELNYSIHYFGPYSSKLDKNLFERVKKVPRPPLTRGLSRHQP